MEQDEIIARAVNIVKSNNKKLTAAACGLPVVSGELYEPLVELVGNASTRADIAQKVLADVRKHYRAEQSAAQWMEYLK